MSLSLGSVFAKVREVAENIGQILNEEFKAAHQEGIRFGSGGEDSPSMAERSIEANFEPLNYHSGPGTGPN